MTDRVGRAVKHARGREDAVRCDEGLALLQQQGKEQLPVHV